MREARPRIYLGAATDWLPRWLAVLFPITIAGSVIGQGMLPSGPGFQGAPPVPQQGLPGPAAQTQNEVNNEISGSALPSTTTPATGQQPGEEGQPAEGTAAPAIAPVRSLMQWGALHLHASASYQFLYATDINTQPGQSSDTFTHTITPVLTANIGPHVTLTYSPSFRFFSERDFHNTVDQFVSLSGGVNVGDWGLGLSQTFIHSDEPLIETGSQTSQNNYNTTASASYHPNDRVSFDTIGTVAITDVNGVQASGITNGVLASSRDYSGTEWANYHFSTDLNAGLGITLGYLNQNGGFSSLSQQYQARVNWNPGPKLSLSVSGGANVEQFLNVDLPDLVSPIYSANIGYRLFDQTLLLVSASRNITASLYQNQIADMTSVGVGVQQRFFGFLQFSAGFAYNTSTYKSTLAVPVFGNLSTVRTDDGYIYTVGLSSQFLKRGTISTFYQYNQNKSSDQQFGFASNQVGVSLAWNF